MSKTIDLADLGNLGFRILGAAAGDNSGISVASAGDVNGDGYDDIIIGASGADPSSRTDAGTSFVIYGGPTTNTAIDLSSIGTRGFAIIGAASGDNSGCSVASAGDVNNDGYSDVIIGARYADPSSRSNAGASYVIYGGPTTNTAIDLSSIGTRGFAIIGAAAFDQSGISVSSAGDVNNDGYDDIIIGAWLSNQSSRSEAGTSYLIYGGSTTNTVLDLANIGTRGFAIFGAAAIDHSGWSVSSAGDVNNDGYDDIIIGAYEANPSSRRDAGTSYVIYGGATTNTAVDLANIGTRGFAIRGAAANDQSGYSVSSAGDVNNDGYSDVIIGARYADPSSRSEAGTSYVIYGGPTTNTAIDLSSIGTGGFAIIGAEAGDNSGFSVSSVRDVNSDGYSDIIIGARYADPSARSDAGKSYVIYGGPTTYSILDLANIGTRGFAIWGAAAGDNSGISVSSAGDVNNDGYDDIIIGALYADQSSRSNAGTSYLIYSSPPSPTSQPTNQPSMQPSGQPTSQPTSPTSQPTNQPSMQPSGQPTSQPTSPTSQPTNQPSMQPTSQPSIHPSSQPSMQPSGQPTSRPSAKPSTQPTVQPTTNPSAQPTNVPSVSPSAQPTSEPSVQPTSVPSVTPSAFPSVEPTIFPTVKPSSQPTTHPTVEPSKEPTSQPTSGPSAQPTMKPTGNPSAQPTNVPSVSPSVQPTSEPSVQPISVPSVQPSGKPSAGPTAQPTATPSVTPSCLPSAFPTVKPTIFPTVNPSSQPTTYPTVEPSKEPTSQPTGGPSAQPTMKPSHQPSTRPTTQPTGNPSTQPTNIPSVSPSVQPTSEPSVQPTSVPSVQPSGKPSARPTAKPTATPSVTPSSLPSYIIALEPTSSLAKLSINSISKNFKISINILGYSNNAQPALETIDIKEGNLGETYLIYGDQNLPANIELSKENNNFLKLPSSLSFDKTTRSLANIGDFNRDGFDDFIIGDPLNSRSYIFNSNGNNYLNMKLGSLILGEGSHDFFGWSVALAGDFNNDGRADLICSALNTGKTYLIFGGKIGNINLADSQANTKVISLSSKQSSLCGLAVEGIGDINNDGYDDVAITAMNSGKSMVFVVFGNNLALDINLDSLNINQGFVSSSIDLANLSLSPLGDVNGDSIDDFIIGAHSLVNRNSQYSYVLYGSTNITKPNLDNLSINEGLKINGAGFFVSQIGDSNNDGMNDILLIKFASWSNNINSYIISWPDNITSRPSLQPSPLPSLAPSFNPSVKTNSPTMLASSPSIVPSPAPSGPSAAPSSSAPTTLQEKSPSFTPSLEPINSLKPSSAPTENITNKPTQKPTSLFKLKAPSFKPTPAPTALNSNNPSLEPTTNVTEFYKSSYVTVFINSGGYYNTENYKTMFIINSLEDVRISAKYSAPYIYKITPNAGMKVIISDFKINQDIISLNLFKELDSLNDLTYQTPPLAFNLPNSQQVILNNLNNLTLTEDNFIFNNVEPIEKKPFDQSLISSIATFFGLSFLVTFCYYINNIVDATRALLGLEKINRAEDNFEDLEQGNTKDTESSGSGNFKASEARDKNLASKSSKSEETNRHDIYPSYDESSISSFSSLDLSDLSSDSLDAYIAENYPGFIPLEVLNTPPPPQEPNL